MLAIENTFFRSVQAWVLYNCMTFHTLRIKWILNFWKIRRIEEPLQRAPTLQSQLPWSTMTIWIQNLLRTFIAHKSLNFSHCLWVQKERIFFYLLSQSDWQCQLNSTESFYPQRNRLHHSDPSYRSGSRNRHTDAIRHNIGQRRGYFSLGSSQRLAFSRARHWPRRRAQSSRQHFRPANSRGSDRQSSQGRVGQSRNRSARSQRQPAGVRSRFLQHQHRREPAQRFQRSSGWFILF